MATARAQERDHSLTGIPHRPFQAYNSGQEHFLTRLYRLEVIRKGLADGQGSDVDGIDLVRLVNYVTYATWRDCVQHDVEGEARDILNLKPAEDLPARMSGAKSTKRSRKTQASRS